MGRFLGGGAQGCVTRAVCHATGADAALKTCSFDSKLQLMAYLDSVITSFDARCCKLVVVPRAIGAYDSSNADDGKCVTVWEEQELLQGDTLEDRLWRTMVSTHGVAVSLVCVCVRVCAGACMCARVYTTCARARGAALL